MVTTARMNVSAEADSNGMLLAIRGCMQQGRHGSSGSTSASHRRSNSLIYYCCAFIYSVLEIRFVVTKSLCRNVTTTYSTEVGFSLRHLVRNSYRSWQRIGANPIVIGQYL